MIIKTLVTQSEADFKNAPILDGAIAIQVKIVNTETLEDLVVEADPIEVETPEGGDGADEVKITLVLTLSHKALTAKIMSVHRRVKG